MEGEIKKDTDNAVVFLPGITITFGNKNSLVFAKTVIQINGECPKEIVQAIVKVIENEGGKP